MLPEKLEIIDLIEELQTRTYSNWKELEIGVEKLRKLVVREGSIIRSIDEMVEQFHKKGYIEINREELNIMTDYLVNNDIGYVVSEVRADFDYHLLENLPLELQRI